MNEIISAREVNELPIGSVVRHKEDGTVVTVVDDGRKTIRWVVPNTGRVREYAAVLVDGGWELLYRAEEPVKVGDTITGGQFKKLPPGSVGKIRNVITVLNKGRTFAEGKDVVDIYGDGSFAAINLWDGDKIELIHVGDND